MNKIRIGVLGPSEIAFRRTVPAFAASNRIEYMGVAHADRKEWSDDCEAGDDVISRETAKCEKFHDAYGGRVFGSYRELLECDGIDAIYIPLPPGLHYKWQRQALQCGKHVFSEKPFTTSLNGTNNNIALAKSLGLALHENYAFVFHRQIMTLDEIVKSGEIGELRMIRAAFAFPYRGENDFRYHENMGGGAIIDCGGYPLKLASFFLGKNISIMDKHSSSSRGHDVDVYGSATLRNRDGLTAQLFWGMDNVYKCDVEIFGSLGMVTTGRVFSPPADMKVRISVAGTNSREILLEPDDQFLHSAEYFCECISDEKIRSDNYECIIEQARIIEEIKNENKEA